MTASAHTFQREPASKSRLAAVSNACVVLGIVAYVAFAVLGYLGSTIVPIDESLALLGGRGVLEGLTPHRDFWSMYPPFNYYLNAMMFRAFAPSFMAARLISVAIYGLAVFAVTIYVNKRLSRQPSPLRWATLGLVVLALTRVLTLPQNNTILTSVLLLTYCIAEIGRGGLLSRRALVISGLACGVLITMRLNLGLYGVASIGAAVVVTGRTFARESLSQRLSRLSIFVAAVAVTVSLFLLSYGRFAKDVVKQLAVTPNLVLRAGHIIDASDLLEPYCAICATVGFVLVNCQLDWRIRRERTIGLAVSAATVLLSMLALRFLSAVHLVLVPYAVPGILIAALLASQLAWKRIPPTVFVGLCFLVASMQHYLIRADRPHLFILAGAAAVVVAAGMVSQPQPLRLAAMGLLFWLMMLFPLPIDRIGIMQWVWPVNLKAIKPALLAMSSGQSFLALGDSRRLTNGQPLLPFERRFFPDEDELAVIRYIDRFALPTDAVFMGLTSHDRTRVNDARLSWAMPRRLASRYLELEPGIITSEAVQREVIQALGAGVRWAVLQDTADTGAARYPFPRSLILDQYLAAHYKRTLSFGKLHVYCRFDACPSS